MTRRDAYLLDDSGLDEAQRLEVVRTVLEIAQDEMTHGEVDIPWAVRDRWPADVSAAAKELRDLYVPEREVSSPYFVTGVQDLTDPAVRRPFVTFAPYAFDATFWSGEHRLIAMSDEGVVSLIAVDEANHARLVDELGRGRLVSHEEWSRRHPSSIRRMVERLRRQYESEA